MPYTRKIIQYGPGPTDFKSVISNRAVAGCWFELHRQGGAGAGELLLNDNFTDRSSIDIGDWIAFEYQAGDRWYFGRVEQRTARSPAGVSLRLEGPGIQLGEVFPGGFGRNVADQVPPHHYARTDLFPNDPDYSEETFDSVSEPDELVKLIMQQYVVPRTDIALDLSLIESLPVPSQITSFKFRGEESVRSIMKELATHAKNASWGVRADRKFFFLQQKSDVIATFREGVDLLSLEESRDREFLFNRIVLTGDYVYDEPVNSEVSARGFFRWRGNYIQPASRDKYGEKRIRIWVPWIRTRSDSREFTREFFRVYAEPTSRFLVEVGNQTNLPKPWDGVICIEDQSGSELISASIETIRVQFDHSPKFRLEIGAEDPRTHWPEPPHDERWEIPGDQEPHHGGDEITFSQSSSSSMDSGSNSSSDLSSELSSSSQSSIDSSSNPLSSQESFSDHFSSSTESDSESLSSQFSSFNSSEQSDFTSSSSGDESNLSSSSSESNISSTQSSSESQSSSSSLSSANSESGSSSESGVISVGCCFTLMPETLTVTITDNDFPTHYCSCADGKTISLQWNGSKWTGSDSFGSCNTTSQISLELECPPGGDFCSDFLLHVSFSDECHPDKSLIPSYCLCSPVDPIDIRFTESIHSNCCDSLVGPVSVIFTITE